MVPVKLINLGAAKRRGESNTTRAIFLSIFRGMSAVCGLRFTDFTQVAFFLQAKISIHINCSRQNTKQSRDLSVCLCYSLLIINNTLKQKGCFVTLKS